MRVGFETRIIMSPKRESKCLDVDTLQQPTEFTGDQTEAVRSETRQILIINRC